MTSTHDTIDELAGVQPDSFLAGLRARRPQSRRCSQQSHLALFDPVAPASTGFTRAERFAVATFVVALHRQPAQLRFHAEGLAGAGAPSGWAQTIAAEAACGAASGPYGRYPGGPLSVEDADGPAYRTSAEGRAVLGDRLAAALAHAHLLVFHPRDAGKEALQTLLDAGWSADDIVTLSQLVAFLAYQLRVVVGLRALDACAAPADSPAQASTNFQIHPCA